ncbi:MAG TPA: DNA polymerase III subunit delta' [Gammaproteobacteria bacterium]|nr:DNA polymerase III subunit delta' [Gammaproteobacteria bacterium]
MSEGENPQSQPALDGPLPWQQDAWARLQRRRSEGRLPHALLITGIPGIGKRYFAEAFLAALLCEGQGEGACGTCRGCRLLAAGSHPDRIAVQPEDEGKAIPVAAVRGLIERLTLRPQYGAWQVALVEPAERMNANAANALLKTLEEPNAGTLLILVSARPSQLPATIRSRCQQITLAAPEPEMGRAWLAAQAPRAQDAATLLALCGGAPLAALELADAGGLEDRAERLAEWEGVMTGRAAPEAVAARWYEQGAAAAVERLHGWLADMIRVAGAGADAGGLRNPDLAGRLQEMAVGLDLQTLFHQLDRVESVRRLVGGPANLQLQLEDLLVAWARAGRSGMRRA